MAALSGALEGLRSLAAHRGRAVASVLGVAWGTFAVVGLQAFGEGLEERMRARAQGFGAGIVINWTRSTTVPYRGLGVGRPLRLVADDVRALRSAVPEIATISPEFTHYETLVAGPRIVRPPISGVDPVFGDLRNLRAEPGGRFLDEADLAAGRRVVFLGDRVAEQLFPSDDAVGSTLTLRNAPFTVVGVLQARDQDSDYGITDDGRVFVPASTYERTFGARYVSNFVYRAGRPDEVPAAIDGVYQALGKRLSFDPADRAAMNVWDTTDGDRIRGMAFLAMDTLMLLAGVCTLLVGAIGIGNLMFLQVRRRTPELGLLMALGARPSEVRRQVLLETCALVALGGLLGFLAAIGLGELVANSPAAENLGRPQVSPGLGAGVVALLALVSLAAGWFPARRASRLDPVLALQEVP